LNFIRRHRVALISLLVALLVFLALYWFACSTGPSTFQYELR
jgi:hypothetical protein